MRKQHTSADRQRAHHTDRDGQHWSAQRGHVNPGHDSVHCSHLAGRRDNRTRGRIDNAVSQQHLSSRGFCKRTHSHGGHVIAGDTHPRDGKRASPFQCCPRICRDVGCADVTHLNGSDFSPFTWKHRASRDLSGAHDTDFHTYHCGTHRGHIPTRGLYASGLTPTEGTSSRETPTPGTGSAPAPSSAAHASAETSAVRTSPTSTGRTSAPSRGSTAPPVTSRELTTPISTPTTVEHTGDTSLPVASSFTPVSSKASGTSVPVGSTAPPSSPSRPHTANPSQPPPSPSVGPTRESPGSATAAVSTRNDSDRGLFAGVAHLWAQQRSVPGQWGPHISSEVRNGRITNPNRGGDVSPLTRKQHTSADRQRAHHTDRDGQHWSAQRGHVNPGHDSVHCSHLAGRRDNRTRGRIDNAVSQQHLSSRGFVSSAPPDSEPGDHQASWHKQHRGGQRIRSFA
ncbi:hypothetical protein MC885_020226 [Smutsia gigantea]|nr:hypothetical protein MC885_020226 [Smutsia gigantea]